MSVNFDHFQSVAKVQAFLPHLSSAEAQVDKLIEQIKAGESSGVINWNEARSSTTADKSANSNGED